LVGKEEIRIISNFTRFFEQKIYKYEFCLIFSGIMLDEWSDKSASMGFFNAAFKEGERKVHDVFKHEFNQVYNATSVVFKRRVFKGSTSQHVNKVCQEALIQIGAAGNDILDSRTAFRIGRGLAYFIAVIEWGVTESDYDGEQLDIVINCARGISSKLKEFDTRHVGVHHILERIEEIRIKHGRFNEFVNPILNEIEKFFK